MARRVRNLAGAAAAEDPACEVALLKAVVKAAELAVDALERGRAAPALVPAVVCQEARRSAQAKLSLDVVLRCNIAAGRTLEEFIIAEAEDGTVPVQMLNEVLVEQGTHFDRLIEIAAKEYEDELARLKLPFARRKAELIIDFAHSESPVVPMDINYDLEGWHLGLIVIGDNPGIAANALVAKSTHRALHVAFDQRTVWVWLSCSHRAPLAELDRVLKKEIPAGVSVAMGEPRNNLDGWRLTHREAEIAQRVIVHRPGGLIRGKDVILLVGAMNDETLARSLIATYMSPLTAHGDSGKTLLRTLRAYFSVGGNAAAAAVSLGVTRHTVQRRIRAVEQALGQPLHTCQPELQVALQLEEMNKAM